MTRSTAFRSRVSPALAAVAALTCAACAPVFSDLQGARLVPPGKVELTPGVSTVYGYADGDSGHIQDQLGLQLATGVMRGAELRARFERLEIADSDDGTNMLGAGPKVALLRDRLAVFAPLGFATGGGLKASETLTFSPTLLATVPLVKDQAELNLSGKYLIPIGGDEDRDTLAAVNVGFALGPHVERWAIRPEIGFLFNPGEDGHYMHFSLGFSFSTP